MSRRCRIAVMILLSLGASACGGPKTSAVSPADPFAMIEVIPMSVGELAGTNVLLLTAGTMVIGDSAHPLADIDVRRTALLVSANAALDSALRRDGREVNWLGLDDQRRAARRNPTLNIDPDHFATQYLFDPRVTQIPDPLWAQVRALAAVSSARYVFVPAAVKISGAPGALTAAYVMVLADARSGRVMVRTRAQGRAAATPEAALTLAAGTIVASSLRRP
jgi:hypothetical protein